MIDPAGADCVTQEQTDAFRAFNRMYTHFIGTLDEGLLQSEFSLAEARVLYELATCGQTRATLIADSLGLDTGYLSRILGKFEARQLLTRSASAKDGRQVELALSRDGEKAFEGLTKRSNDQAQTVLGRLSTANRGALLCAMATIERLLRSGPTLSEKPAPVFVLREPRPGDLGWVVHREASIYASEEGWDERFEALVAQIVVDFVAHYNRKRERCWIADLHGRAVGHVFLVSDLDDIESAKLRLLLVEPEARGMGLGFALVTQCVEFARSAGYRRVTLWTQSHLGAARRTYAKAGFRKVGEEWHHMFGPELLGETWSLDLHSAPNILAPA